MLLGAAKYLAETRNFAGTVHFIFQPAEEGGGGGGRMVDEGLFQKHPCSEVYGMVAPAERMHVITKVFAGKKEIELTLHAYT